jgi:hypothetical protein
LARQGKRGVAERQGKCSSIASWFDIKANVFRELRVMVVSRMVPSFGVGEGSFEAEEAAEHKRVRFASIPGRNALD